MRAWNRLTTVWVCGMILVMGISREAGAEDWSGAIVFPRQERTPLRYEERTVGTFSYDARVMRDLGEWIEVRHSGGEDGKLGCVRKGEVVQNGEAVDFFTGVIREQPNSSWAYVNRGRAWLNRGERSIALEDLDEAVRLDPRSAAYNQRGLLRIELKDFAGAVRDFDEVIRLDPQGAYAYNNRGYAKHGQKEHAGAIRDYNEAIRLSPKDAVAYNNRGNVKLDQKDYPGAIHDYGEAIRLDPKYPAPYCNLGNARSEQKDSAGAVQAYDEAIRLDSKVALFYNNRGFEKHKRRDYAGAIRDYREAIRLDEKLKYHRINYAFLLATATDEKIRDAGEALRLAEEVLKQEPTDAYAKNAKACGLALRGDYAEAIRWEREALQDADFTADDSLDGGKRGLERIASWEQKKLWLQP